MRGERRLGPNLSLRVRPCLVTRLRSPGHCLRLGTGLHLRTRSLQMRRLVRPHWRWRSCGAVRLRLGRGKLSIGRRMAISARLSTRMHLRLLRLRYLQLRRLHGIERRNATFDRPHVRMHRDVPPELSATTPD